MKEVVAKNWQKHEPALKELAKQPTVHARLKDFGGSPSEVTIRSNPIMRKNRLLEITIGDETAIIDIDQMNWHTRLI